MYGQTYNSIGLCYWQTLLCSDGYTAPIDWQHVIMTLPWPHGSDIEGPSLLPVGSSPDEPIKWQMNLVQFQAGTLL